MESIFNNIGEYWNVIHDDRKPANEHRGQFNTPTSNEVALVIVGQVLKGWDIVVHNKDTKLMQITETYDALQYQLIFYYRGIPVFHQYPAM